MSATRPTPLTIFQVDAFTDVPYRGNPAAVVLEPGDLTEQQMQLLAREMNLSETAYLLPPSSSAGDLRLRWFTPAAEVDLCGHATVATFHAGLEEGRLTPGSYRLECRSGILDIGLARGADGRALVTMALPVPILEGCFLDRGHVAGALGIPAQDLSDTLPMERTGEWVVVPVSGLEVLRRMEPDFKALGSILRQGGLGSAVVLTRETIEPSSGVHLRMFAPGFGIDEDPVTGSAQGPVAVYLAKHGLLAAHQAGKEARYIAEQGDIIGRPGRIGVRVAFADGRPAAITIEGRAVTILKGSIMAPGRA